MSNKSQTLEYFFYKHYAGDFKSDISHLLKFGAAGVGVKTIARELILEKDFFITLDELKSQISMFDRDLDVDAIINSLIDTKELYIKDGYVQSRVLDIQVKKQHEARETAGISGRAGQLIQAINSIGYDSVLDKYKDALELTGTSIQFRDYEVKTKAQIKATAFKLADVIIKAENFNK